MNDRRRPPPRAFTLLETLVALGLFGVLVASVVSTFSGSIQLQGKSRQEWAAFSLAQQQLELLTSLPPTSPMLVPNSPLVAGVLPGSEVDATCSTIPVGAAHFRTDPFSFNRDVSSGTFEVCTKVSQGSPFGALLNIRVVVLYPTKTGTGHVLLHTIR